ncbi:metal-dependent hydrolase [Thermus sp. PS18]|uniref:metal-dependent hydrolase n=1 Tax=Thermus sp. PS18 TaxID=2849039 RepID=UPI00226490EF|nr:metal-dependent hydrolase [Thermus sp. PS18]UZX14429.1 metal-dependent hydrolase [Thermus sp. PS18]
MLEIRYLGHSAVWLSDGKTKVVIDPFLTGNPVAPVGVGEVQADLILVTHAHGDHFGDAVALSKKGGTVVSTFEIATYAEKHGAKALPMNIGGTYRFPGGWLKWFPAWHSSSFPDGTYGGMPMGVVVELGGKRIYHAGDTALFSDMRLIGELGLDLAFLPIGDHFTMGPEDALKALELLKPKRVVPIHYNTFPPIRQDGDAFAERTKEKGVEGHALKPGGVLVLD